MGAFGVSWTVQIVHLCVISYILSKLLYSTVSDFLHIISL